MRSLTKALRSPALAPCRALFRKPKITVSAAVLWLAAAPGLVRAEAYVAGYVGGAATRAADVTLEQPDLGNRVLLEQVPFSGKSFESAIYYGYRAGYYFTRHFGLEAELVHLKIHADLNQPVSVRGTLQGSAIRLQAPMARYADQFEISHGLNLVLVNAVFRQALIGGPEPASARLTFVGRAGLGPTVPHPETVVFGEASSGYELGPLATQAAAGVEAKLWRGLHILAEYKYTFTPTAIAIANGEATLNVHSHHAVTGLAVHF